MIEPTHSTLETTDAYAAHSKRHLKQEVQLEARLNNYETLKVCLLLGPVVFGKLFSYLATGDVHYRPTKKQLAQTQADISSYRILFTHNTNQNFPSSSSSTERNRRTWNT